MPKVDWERVDDRIEMELMELSRPHNHWSKWDIIAPDPDCYGMWMKVGEYERPQCYYCKTFHTDQFCPGCGASRGDHR